MVSADELTSPGAPGLASLVLTTPGRRPPRWRPAIYDSQARPRPRPRPRPTSHALLSAYARRGSPPGQGPRAAGVRTPPGPSAARATGPAARRTAGGSVGAAPGRSPQRSSRNRPPRSAACCPAPIRPRCAPTRRSGRARGPGRPIDGRHQSAPGRRPPERLASQCFRDGLAPLPTACVNQDAVPAPSSTRAVARPMPSVDADDRHDRHAAQADGPARTGVADS